MVNRGGGTGAGALLAVESNLEAEEGECVLDGPKGDDARYV